MDRTRFGRGQFEKRTFVSPTGLVIMYIDRSVKGRAYRRLGPMDQKILAHGQVAKSAQRLAGAMGWKDPKRTVRHLLQARQRFHAAMLAEIAAELAGVRLGRSRRAMLLRMRQQIR